MKLEINQFSGVAPSQLADSQWPTAKDTMFIPIYDFMKLPCKTPQSLITTLKMQMRLHGCHLDNDSVIQITIEPGANVVRVESFPEVPF